MQRRYRRRTAVRYGGSGHYMFGGTGWLFADLLLALAIAFLLATTVGSVPPRIKPKPTPTGNTTHNHPPQLPPLQLDPVHIKFTIADPVGLADGTTSAVAAVRTTILHDTSGIKARSAGIVLLFGGDGGNESTYPTWQQVDRAVENVLKSLSGTGKLFHQETRYVPFLSLGEPAQFSMDVYLFSKPG